MERQNLYHSFLKPCYRLTNNVACRKIYDKYPMEMHLSIIYNRTWCRLRWRHDQGPDSLRQILNHFLMWMRETSKLGTFFVKCLLWIMIHNFVKSGLSINQSDILQILQLCLLVYMPTYLSDLLSLIGKEEGTKRNWKRDGRSTEIPKRLTQNRLSLRKVQKYVEFITDIHVHICGGMQFLFLKRCSVMRLSVY